MSTIHGTSQKCSGPLILSKTVSCLTLHLNIDFAPLREYVIQRDRCINSMHRFHAAKFFQSFLGENFLVLPTTFICQYESWHHPVILISYYNLDLMSICLLLISSAIYRPIGTKLGRNMSPWQWRHGNSVACLSKCKCTIQCNPVVRMSRWESGWEPHWQWASFSNNDCCPA